MCYHLGVVDQLGERCCFRRERTHCASCHCPFDLFLWLVIRHLCSWAQSRKEMPIREWGKSEGGVMSGVSHTGKERSSYS